MLFAGDETREEILNVLKTNKDSFENVVAMANIGMAFTQIIIFENQVAELVSIGKVQLKKKLAPKALSASQLYLDRLNDINSSTLGRLITAIEMSGIAGRDIRYLRAILELRNDFVHKFTKIVPLPGDWARHGFTVERFSEYTRFVTRHANRASFFFPRIMVKHGLLAGTIRGDGWFLGHPDDPFRF
jgi:hypothetical protein